MAWTRTYDGDEPQRVNKWLAQSGVCSRREAETLIEKGLVSVDGETVRDPGRKIARGQTLTLADAAQDRLAGAATIVLNKPVNYVSAQPEKGQVPAARLVTRETLFGQASSVPGRDVRLAPAGRLDQDSRGLLLLTEDGVLTKAVIGETSGVDKEYLVTVTGKITPDKLAKLRHGLSLDGRELRPAQVSREDGQVLRFILNEGRKRQIRRMCEQVGLHVVDLFRIRIGPVSIGDLPEGQWRPLAPEERAALLTMGAQAKSRIPRTRPPAKNAPKRAWRSKPRQN